MPIDNNTKMCRAVEYFTQKEIMDNYSSGEIYSDILWQLQDKQQLGKWKLDGKLAEETEELILHIVEDVCINHPNYAIRQKLRAGKLLVNKDSENKGFLVYNPLKLDQIKISHRSLYNLLTPFEIKKKLYHCKFDWDPYSKIKLSKRKDGLWDFNQYQPAKWMGDDFYTPDFIFPNNELPEIYKVFFMHLVDNDKKSFDYVLNWLAQVVQPNKRNFCILTTIGQQGVGKGILGEIMMNLVNIENFSGTSQKAISGTFNKQLLYKLVVYINEIEVKTISDENRLKGYIDETVEIEAKHVDAMTIQNHANLYISTNNEDALRLTADDRRFSIVNLTKTKMTPEYWENISNGTSIPDLFALKNIKKLGNFLMNKEVDSKQMVKPLKTLLTEEIREASLKIWEHWVIHDLCWEKAGTEMPLSDVSDLIESKFGSRTRPSTYAMRKLEKVYPNKFSLKRKQLPNGKREWYICFNQKDKK